jgi:hypothetical protein
MAGEPQEQVQLLTIPFDWHLSHDDKDELALLCVPHGKNMQVDVLSVGVTGRIVGSGALTARAEWRDALRTASNGLATTMAAYTVTNVTPDRVLDCDSTSITEMADVLGTLIADLTAGLPLPEYTITNLTRALAYNEGATDEALLADQIGQIINDIVDGRIVDVVFTEGNQTDRTFDADTVAEPELSDILSVVHRDLTPTAYLHAAANLVNQGIEGYISLWNGSLILDQGDALNLEVANSAGTDKEGYAAIVEFRVLRHAGG